MKKILLALIIFLIPTIAVAEITEITVTCDKPTFNSMREDFPNVSTTQFGYTVRILNDNNNSNSNFPYYKMRYYYEDNFINIPVVVKGKRLGVISVPADRGCVYSMRYDIIAVRNLEIIE